MRAQTRPSGRLAHVRLARRRRETRRNLQRFSASSSGIVRRSATELRHVTVGPHGIRRLVSLQARPHDTAEETL